ncbi:MAG: YgiT-type zinc finger protein [Chitinivibrionales bacterium]|nr:YgiT-type zinc finger protein [Chitinivibrionales bacterium]
MVPFENCPVCGGDIETKKVEKLLKGGQNVASITVDAEVCLHCGERLNSKTIVTRFEQIRQKLACNDTTGLEELGHSYKAVA